VDIVDTINRFLSSPTAEVLIRISLALLACVGMLLIRRRMAGVLAYLLSSTIARSRG